MKRLPPSDESRRFKGGMRSFHRAGPPPSSWEDWVNGEELKQQPGKNWWKIIGIMAALLALGGIIAGLIIELS
ncbi:MAG: hypothetical protein NTW21_27645 [Verrucomicrobia bacterium]|nr:hypothetical protein [Verrucomicrobiota bacterium]